MKKTIRSLLVVATFVGIAGATANARADTPGESSAQTALVNKLTDEGLTLYSAHEYRRAIEKFMAAYSMNPDPNLIFNTARCYERLGDARAAVDKYESFLAEPGGDPTGRRKAEEALASLRKTKAAGSAHGTTPREGIGTDTPKNAGKSSGPPWTALGWVSLGVGVTAGVTGTAVFLSGKSDQDQVTGTSGFGHAASMQVAGITQANAQELVDRGNSKKVGGEVLWGLAGAAVVAAAVCFLVQRGSGESAVSVGIAPSAAGGAITVAGGF